MLGYLVIYGYIFFSILVLGKLLLKITPVELSRKFIHISLFMVWVFIDIFFKNTIHQVIIPFTFIIINYLSYKFKLFKSIERDEDNHLGTVYFSIAIFVMLLVAYILPELYIYTGISTFCLTFGDGFASLIGSSFKSKKIKDNKSILGFVSCFIFSLISLIGFKYFYLNELLYTDILIIASFSAILELVGKGLDNFSIVFGTFIISILLLTTPFGMLDIGLIVSIIVFLIVFFTKSISYYGALLSIVIMVIFSYCGDIYTLVYLLISYFIAFFIALFKKIIKQAEKKEKSGRGLIQIFVNGFTGCFSLILFKIFNNQVFYIASFVCIGGCLVDSVSSDIGNLSKQQPFDLFKFRKVERKLSGGMTILGTLASLLISVILGVLIIVFTNNNIYIGLIFICIMFLDTIIDSFIGSIFQNKNKCNICGKITELKEHCDNKTSHYSGLKYFNNNLTNFVTSLIIFGIIILILW